MPELHQLYVRKIVPIKLTNNREANQYAANFGYQFFDRDYKIGNPDFDAHQQILNETEFEKLCQLNRLDAPTNEHLKWAQQHGHNLMPNDSHQASIDLTHAMLLKAPVDDTMQVDINGATYDEKVVDAKQHAMSPAYQLPMKRSYRKAYDEQMAKLDDPKFMPQFDGLKANYVDERKAQKSSFDKRVEQQRTKRAADKQALREIANADWSKVSVPTASLPAPVTNDSQALGDDLSADIDKSIQDTTQSHQIASKKPQPEASSFGR